LFFVSLLLFVFFEGIAPAATWQAEMNVRVYSPNVPLIHSKASFYQKDQKLRIVPSDSEEYKLYDFERGLAIRIFPRDRIYFEKPLSLANTIKAMKEAWISAPPPFEESRILLRKGLFQGKQAALYFMIFSNKDQRAYALRWLTDDAESLPLRIIYPGSARETIILDYLPLKAQEIPPDSFDPPADYLNLNPF